MRFVTAFGACRSFILVAVGTVGVAHAETKVAPPTAAFADPPGIAVSGVVAPPTAAQPSSLQSPPAMSEGTRENPQRPVFGANASEAIQPRSGAEAPQSDASRDAPTDVGERDRTKKEHLRVGVIGGVGFPRPLAVEALVKVERTFAIGAEYSILPTLSISGVQTNFHAISADARVFPFQGPFVNPRIGLLWTFEPGFTVGIDAGIEFPLSSSTSTTLPPGTVANQRVLNVANSYGSSVLPTIDLLRIGFLI